MNFVLKVEMKRLDEEIKRKNEQIDQLEKKIVGSFISSHDEMDKFETSRVSSASLVDTLLVYYSHCP